jgi:hypothetical protein
MELLQLPLELVLEVLIQAVAVRGLKRGLRLRLVCSTYSTGLSFSAILIDL